MVKTNQSMFPGKKKFDMNQIALKIIENNIDAFSKAIGFPSDINKHQKEYETAVLKHWISKHRFNLKSPYDSYGSMLRSNSTSSPHGRYIKKWVNSNKEDAIGFLQAKNKYKYKRKEKEPNA
tara:strand:- start:1352 stop:1717 length:366 start_codon:yes stop_codon:yes gene_type:complete